MNHVSARHLYLVKLAWLWLVRASLLVLLHAQHTITPLVQIRETSFTLGMRVFLSRFIAASISFLPQLPYQAGWQDLKDLFRSAGNIIRADINIGADGRPKGSGTVIFETSKDAQQAISACRSLPSLTTAYDVGLGMYNGFDWYGRVLEVREVRFAFHTIPLPRVSYPIFRIVMRACPALAVSAVVSAAGPVACVVAFAVLASVGAAVASHVEEDTPEVAVPSRTKTYTRTIRARTSRREGTAQEQDTKEDIRREQQATAAVMVSMRDTRQSQAGRSWFAT